MDHVIYERPDIAREFRSDQEHFFLTEKEVSLKDRICLSPMVKYVLPVFGIMVLLMGAVYLTLYVVLENSPDEWPATCNIRSSYRVDCLPGRNETMRVTYESCMAVDCCWHDETQQCFHSIPSRHGYTPKNSGPYHENETLVPRKSTSPLGSRSAESVALELNNIDANHVIIILKISPATRRKTNVREDPIRKEELYSSGRGGAAIDELSRELLYFLPENPLRRTVNFQADVGSNMDVYFHSPEFSVTVTRKNDTSGTLLSTARGPFILTDTFWELTLYITNSTLYGLNQLELNGTTNWIYNNDNGTSRPAFLGVDEDGRATSCYVDYDGPMEVKVLDGSNLVVLRGLSLPKEISLNVFYGPTPLDAVRQLTKALQKDSQREDIPVSSLGLHVCPNDDSTEFIESLKSTIDIMRVNKAPWDSHCLHQGFNPSLGNSLNDTQSQIVDEALELLANYGGGGGRILVPHLSPMLFAEDSTLATELANSSLLLCNSSGPYVGQYRGRGVVYPDWFDRRTFEASLSNLTDYLNKLAASKLFYVRDSWPKDETGGHSTPADSKYDYVPKGLARLMSNGTVPYALRSSSRTNFHYAEHNAYSEKFRNTCTLQGRTSLTIRGLWGESGNSSWAALRAGVRVGVGSGLVGQLPPPMYVCGTGDDLGPNSNDELCSRWYGAAVVWPHVLALPTNLPGGVHLTLTASRYAVKHLKLRASLLTYRRTILAEHYTRGSPLLAPTSVHYPKDLRARGKWNQFLWGDSILVGLVTLPRVSQVSMWLPGKYPWRHLHGGSEIDPSNSSATSVTAAEGQIVTLVRPGHIVPLHEEISMTSALTLKNQLTLVVNLACDEECSASGKIFYGDNDGEFLLITASNSTLQLTNILKVKERSCNSDGSVQQATLIKNVVILGTSPREIATELCNIEGDSYSTDFTDNS